jgi:formyl-CoA transferase
MMDFQAARYLMDADVPEPVGNGHPTIVPTGSFPTQDGFVNVAPSSPRQWRGFCQALGQADWIAKPEWKGFTDRLRARAEIDEAIAAVTRTQTTKYWVDRLEEAGIPCGPIYRMDEVFADPQVQHLGIAAPVAHPDLGETRLVGSPLNLDGVPKRIREAAAIEVNTDPLAFET